MRDYSSDSAVGLTIEELCENPRLKNPTHEDDLIKSFLFLPESVSMVDFDLFFQRGRLFTTTASRRSHTAPFAVQHSMCLPTTPCRGLSPSR